MVLPDPLLSSVDWPDAPVCLMSRLSSQEKWEEMLDGLLNLARNQPATGKKDSGGSRIGYLVDMKFSYIQPIVQTMNAKGGWSAGRIISLKRFKDQSIDGLTDQDRRLANAITHQSGYYQASQYYLDFNKGVVELCGHPYLFAADKHAVSLELVRAQPEMITEQLKTGIRLKTNITQTDQSLIIIQENQTRYQIIKLDPQQQAIIRMISHGVTIPERGKKKLLDTIAGLSGMMTVHSDLVSETTAARTVTSDSRIRVQILPFGEGLKVEGFVKPLGSAPPYLKPGKGGKVIYGLDKNEKVQAIRDLPAEKGNAETLASAISLRMDADIITETVNFSDPYEILELLDILGNHADITTIEWPEGVKFGIRQSVSWSDLSLRISGRRNWFDLDGELAIDESTVLSLEELIRLNRKSKGRFIEMKSGEFLALAENFKKQLDELDTLVTVNRSGISINQLAAHAVEDFAQKAGSWKSDKKWKEYQKLLSTDTWSEVMVPETLDGELRTYQEEGFRWMVRLNTWGAGACLADDMGLGKTIQAIAMMLHLSGNGPALVVCPASVISNWGQELASFAPTLNPVMLKPGNRTSVFASLSARNVLIISYGLLQTEQSEIEQINWSMAILDEAHAIKNTQTKSSKSAMSIQAGFKLALTGTPIQNHLGELWNLFNFSNPGLLGTLAQFTDRYIKNDNPVQKHHLKKLITPFILRRTKNKVLDELPPKTEITYPVQLSDQEMAFYEALRREAVATIENGTGPLGKQHLQALAELTRLRLACCNTRLVDKNIAIPSSKLEAFLEITGILRANGHRALVFSQFVSHLTLIRVELNQLGIRYQYLDGSTSLPDRERAVKAFQSGHGELFLISLKAGGLGLNLTAADYVIHLDPWWNPAVEDQASDRSHRIGQAKPVTIYRLVAANTIEEKIVKLHHTKRDLADSLLEGTDLSARLSTTDLLDFIRES
jgi:superfamily II DNA or RNA helicase